MRIERIVEDHVADREQWEKHATLFSSFDWIKYYDQNLLRFAIVSNKGNFQGGFVAFEGGKPYAKTLITPPYAPHIGLFFHSGKENPSQELSARKQVMQAMASFLKSSSYIWYKLEFPPEWADMQPLIWAGISVTPRYTYRICLQEKKHQWLHDTDAKLRNMIAKAKKENFKIEIRKTDEPGQNLISEKFLKETTGKKQAAILERITSDRSGRFVYFAQLYREEKPVYSSVFLISHQDEAYYLLAHYDSSDGSNTISAFGLYHIIQYCIDQNCTWFDFEGSMIPGVEKFFRSFGGNLTTYFSVTGGKPLGRWLINVRRKLKKN